MTNLPNRTLLTKLVDQALTVAQRSKLHGCVLFIDLNRFKMINDTLAGRSATNCCATSPSASAPLRDQDLRAWARRIRRRPVRHQPALRSQHGRAQAAGRAQRAVPDRRP
ncbi:diguanylate cyclase domain-containing protein [Rugamonas sp. CCM 8940]